MNSDAEVLSILVAEDSSSNQLMAVSLLEGEGHRVRVANNGKKAVELFEQEDFDLILMDIEMPEMDGIEATREIRKRERETAGRLLIIALSADSLHEDRMKCLNAGMDGCIGKPVRMDDLHRILDGEFEAAPMTASPLRNPKGKRGVVDWNGIKETVGGSRELLETVLKAIFVEVPDLMSKLETAVAQHDSDAVKHHAHTLKGTMQTVYVESAAHQAMLLEHAGRDGHLKEMPNQFAELSRLVDLVMEELKQPPHEF